jgi:adenine-specific DNA-methyltransferase
MTKIPEKLDLASHDYLTARKEELLRLFPMVRTEDGLIDFEKLKRLLGEFADVGRERYGMTWPGKAECFQAIQIPSMGTLLPIPTESLNFDTTENLFIEGDNLEALKLLQKSYVGKIKMVYIDPPYNTGSDFIYPDNYSESLQAYLEYTKQVDDEGRRFGTNSDTEGRFHSRWMNMIYPRLHLAWNLLSDDGVIFISIDDGEEANLRKMCDEVFGEENFVEKIIWKKRSTPPNDKIIGANHDYILIFAKNINSLSLNLRARTDIQVARYKNSDNHPKGPWAPGDLMANVKGGRYVPSLYFPIKNPKTGEEHYPGKNGNWRFNKGKIEQLIANNEIYFGEDGKGRPKLKRFLRDVKEGVTYPTIWDFVPLNTQGSEEMTKIFGNMTTFENPKPSGLIKELLRLGSDEDSIVLDYFAGSGTTAHAVLELNKETQGNRKFILIQLPEPTNNKDFPTIAEITKERIRRVIKTLNDQEFDELPLDKKQDKGFRVFKLAESNFRIWDSNVAKNSKALEQQLELHLNHIRDERTNEDVLYEILLKSGFPLTTPAEQIKIEGKIVYNIGAGSMFVCLERDLTIEFVRSVATKKPARIVCLDLCFLGNDQLKANAAQIFKNSEIVFKTV